MKKHDIDLRIDFFETDSIQALKGDPDEDKLIVAYIFLSFWADDDGYIHDNDLEKISEDYGCETEDMHDRIMRLVDFNLAEIGCGGYGYFLKPQEEL